MPWAAENCCTQVEGGTGSVVCVVAAELSLVSEKEPLDNVTLAAFAKLSLAGAAAITVNVGKICVADVVVPPPGGGFRTPTELVLPKLAMKVAGTMAESCVALTKVVGMGVPLKSGFIRTTELDPKFVPVTVICVAAAFTFAVSGDAFVIVGAPPRTVKVNALLRFGLTNTVTLGAPPPATMAVVTVPEIWVSVGVPTVARAVPPN